MSYLVIYFLVQGNQSKCESDIRTQNQMDFSNTNTESLEFPTLSEGGNLVSDSRDSDSRDSKNSKCVCLFGFISSHIRNRTCQYSPFMFGEQVNNQ